MPVTANNLGSASGLTNGITREYSVASGVTVHDREFVYINADGRVSSASIDGLRLLGSVVGGDTQNLDRNYSGSATGNADGTVRVLVNIDPEERYLLKNDNVATTFVAAHVGDYFDITGSASNQLVDTSTVGATGQLVCLRFNPGIRGTDSTYGIFRIAEYQLEL